MKKLLACCVCLVACSGGGRTSGDGGLVVDLATRDSLVITGDLAPEIIERFYAHDADELYVVDPTTFALTTIGAFGTATPMNDLAVNAHGEMFGVTSTAVYRIDATSGVATMLAPVSTTSNVALTFEPNGTLLSSDKDGKVFRIEPSNGSSTEIGSYGSGFDTAGDLVAVSDGTMYGIAESGPGTTTASNVLLKVNTTDGTATGVGPIGFKGVFGVAYSKGNVIAFTKTGEIIKINPTTGAGTLVKSYPGKVFYGAGSNPLQPPIG